jgi:hypothetical protein
VFSLIDGKSKNNFLFFITLTTGSALLVTLVRERRLRREFRR